MSWKEDFADALFPFDERVINLAYCFKGTKSSRELLDKIVPNRRKPNIDIALRLMQENIPELLFKYRSFDSSGYSLSNFQNDMLWLSKPCSFNDPFDSVSKEDLGVLVGLYDEFEKEGSISSEMKTTMKKLVNLHITKTQILFYVGCLSGINDSVLMWSHYADMHTGFCVGYSGIELFENNTITKNIYPVLYYDFDEVQYDDSELGLDYAGLYSVLRKSKQWEYEHEWRVVLSLREIDSPRNIQLPNAKVVYLGVKISEENKKSIMKIAKSNAIPVFQAIMNITTGKLDFKPTEE